MARKPTPRKPIRRWRIILVRAKGAPLGTVEAPDAESAIEIGAREFGYDARRLIAQPLE